MARRIDYLADLGVTCLWLMPFYPTPDRDDGYDITDFYGVDPRLGTLGDFVELVRTAQRPRHPGDRRPRRQPHLGPAPVVPAARRSKDNPYRDYYVWRVRPAAGHLSRSSSPTRRTASGSSTRRTGEWYLHHFYQHQPDLNIANPEVRDEIAKTMGFWLAARLSGFRVDAVPFLFAEDVDAAERRSVRRDPHDYLRTSAAFLGRRVGDGVLLGEVNLPLQGAAAVLRRRATATSSRCSSTSSACRPSTCRWRAATRALSRRHCAARPRVDPASQWANFLRNHDELTLDKLTDEERQEVFDAFGPDEDMQLYGRGLRRRLPTMLGGDPRRIRMAYCLMFSLPGTPVLFYGEEIGMGENLDIDGRMSVRTPMQWTAGENGGFSSAPRRRLPRPVPTGVCGPSTSTWPTSATTPTRCGRSSSASSRRYRQSPEIGWSDVEILEQSQRSVLAHVCRYGEWAMLAVHNFGDQPVEVEIEVPGLPPGSVLVDLLVRRAERLEPDDRGRLPLTLAAYDHRWLRVASPGDRRIA